MQSTKTEECSAAIRKRVAAASSVQIKRQGLMNCLLDGNQLTQRELELSSHFLVTDFITQLQLP